MSLLGHSDIAANYTLELARSIGHGAPDYKGYPVITRDSESVLGGVYGTRNPDSEFVHVDNINPLIARVVDNYLVDISNFTYDPMQVLRIAMDTTADVLRYDKEAADILSEPYYDDGGIIPLSDYVREGTGVCRHQALLNAVLLKSAINEGAFEGAVRVERNMDTERVGGHAWAVVYVEGMSEDIIIDSAQKFVGTRAEASERGLWRYYVDTATRRMAERAITQNNSSSVDLQG